VGVLALGLGVPSGLALPCPAMNLEELRQQLAAFREFWEQEAASDSDLRARVEDFAKRDEAASLEMQMHLAHNRSIAQIHAFVFGLAEGVLGLAERVEAMEQRDAERPEGRN
jgi:hypothetical protein